MPHTPATAIAAIEAALTHPDMGTDVRLVVAFEGGPCGSTWAARIEDEGAKTPHAWGHGWDPTSALIALASNLDLYGDDAAH